MRISDWSSDVCSSDLIVLGRQVDGGEIAAHERRGVGRVAAQQFQHAETVALGLEYPPVLHRAELADGTVGGAEDGPWRLVQRPEGRRVGTACVGQGRSRWSP